MYFFTLYRSSQPSNILGVSFFCITFSSDSKSAIIFIYTQIENIWKTAQKTEKTYFLNVSLI
jgi:hypothetical protein